MKRLTTEQLVVEVNKPKVDYMHGSLKKTQLLGASAVDPLLSCPGGSILSLTRADRKLNVAVLKHLGRPLMLAMRFVRMAHSRLMP
jgi:hypothetical protein